MRVNSRELLRLANIIPKHNLKEVRVHKDFDTWGVDYTPGTWPSVLWVGDHSEDFHSKCWPFLAAHEALHTISTQYADMDDYQFFLYNVCEDWRVNTCLLGVFGELKDSYEAAREVILRRWRQAPIQQKSPISAALQHICYLNHTYTPKAEISEQAEDFLQEILFLRSQFADENNWPLLQPDRDRGDVNKATYEKLMEMIKAKKAPRGINIDELRRLIRRMGYDLDSFRAVETKPAIEIKKLNPEPALSPTSPTPPPAAPSDATQAEQSTFEEHVP
jgi:hypothetical protein